MEVQGLEVLLGMLGAARKPPDPLIQLHAIVAMPRDPSRLKGGVKGRRLDWLDYRKLWLLWGVGSTVGFGSRVAVLEFRVGFGGLGLTCWLQGSDEDTTM